jgi:hypothetical protein
LDEFVVLPLNLGKVKLGKPGRPRRVEGDFQKGPSKARKFGSAN